MKRIAAALVSLALGFTAACSTTEGTATAPERTGSLADALATVPSSVTRVTYYDQARAMERWGLADLDATAFDDESKAEQLHTYIEKSGQSAIGSQLSQYAAQMGDWGWSGLSVDWEISFLGGEGPPITISRLRDEVDMNTVMDSLTEHGFSRSGDADRIRFDRDMNDIGQDLAILISGATVIPSQHLLINTADAEFALPPAAESLAADDTVSRLLAGLRAADFVQLTTGDDACIDPAAALGQNATPEMIEAATADWPDLEPIVGSATVLIDDDTGAARTLYNSADSAAKDVENRQKLLTDGVSLVAGQPFTEFLTATVSANDAVLKYDIVPVKLPAAIPQSAQRNDTPWAFCK